MKNEAARSISSLLTALKLVVFYSMLVISLTLFFLCLRAGIPVLAQRDADIFCLAGKAIQAGKNPYLTSDLGSPFSWNYLPVYAYGFDYLCRHISFAFTYGFLYTAIFFTGIAIWTTKSNWLYGVTIIGTGLYSFGWVLRTGNLGAIEFFAISISSGLLLRRRYNEALLLLGLGSSIKLFPLLYFPIFIALIPGMQQKLRAATWGLSGFLLPFVISYFAAPELMPWYFKQLLGSIPNQHSPINEAFGFYQPVFVALLAKLLPLQIETKTLVYVSLVIYLTCVALGVIAYKQTSTRRQPSQSSELFFLSAGIIIITLLMPRIKSYSFMPALLFIFVITKDFDRWYQSLIILIASILPMWLNIQYQSIALQTNTPLNQNSILLAIREFNQPICLGATMVFALIILAKGRNKIFETQV